MPGPELAGLRIADPPERWAEIGFVLEGRNVRVGGIDLELGVAGRGIVDWVLREPNGLVAEPAPEHPNRVLAVDHLVMLTGGFDATAAGLAAAGMALRRVREVPVTEGEVFRQGFRRLGPAILEVVETLDAPLSPERFWGVTFVVEDLEVLGRFLGDRLGSPRNAVQPGRRIATLRQSAGLTCAVAFITPEQRIPG